MAKKKWIQKSGIDKNKGGLHRALGVPEGEKIPEDKLEKALHSKDEHVRKMAQFAKTAKGFKHKSHKKLAEKMYKK